MNTNFNLQAITTGKWSANTWGVAKNLPSPPSSLSGSEVEIEIEVKNPMLETSPKKSVNQSPKLEAKFPVRMMVTRQAGAFFKKPSQKPSLRQLRGNKSERAARLAWRNRYNGKKAPKRTPTFKCNPRRFPAHQDSPKTVSLINRAGTMGHNVYDATKPVQTARGNGRAAFTVQTDKPVPGQGALNPFRMEFPSNPEVVRTADGEELLRHEKGKTSFGAASQKWANPERLATPESKMAWLNARMMN